MVLAVKVIIETLNGVAEFVTLTIVEVLPALRALTLLPRIIHQKRTVTSIPVTSWAIAHLVTIGVRCLCNTLFQWATVLRGRRCAWSLTADTCVVTETKALEIRGSGNLMAGTPIVARQTCTTAIGTQATIRSGPSR